MDSLTPASAKVNGPASASPAAAAAPQAVRAGGRQEEPWGHPPRVPWWWTGLALLLLGVALLCGWWWGPGRPEVGVWTASRRDLVQTLVSSGRVQSPHRVDVGVRVLGTVKEVGVVLGQRVSRGQVLLELQADELQAQRLQAQAQWMSAQQRLRAVREVQRPLAELNWRQAQAGQQVALAALMRQWALYEQGFVGQAALDEGGRAYIVSQAQLLASRQQFEALEEEGSETAVALANAWAAQAAWEQAKVRWRERQLRSPVDGLVMARQVEVGDVLQPGRSAFTLLPDGPTELLLKLDERHLGRLQLGQRAWASADALPAQAFEARLSQIDPAVQAQTGSVDVKLRVPQPPAALKQDMTVSVEIELDRRPGALAVPMAALQGLVGDRAQVWRLSQGRLEPVAVRLGMKAGAWAEVLEGLAAGDPVVVQAQSPREGQRVRVRPLEADHLPTPP
jgi:HlyD family secretion protein